MTTWGCLAAGVSGSADVTMDPACPSGVGRLESPASGPAAIVAPGAPTGLTSLVGGTLVTLIWSAPGTGDTPTSYVVEAGSTPGASNLANMDTGSTATTLAVSNVGPGTYFIRVRARNGAGQSAPSNEITFTIGGGPCSGLPSAPGSLTGSASGSSVTLAWSASAGATSYVVEAGATPGSAGLASVDVGSNLSFSTAGVGAGTYYIRVRGKNACGTGAASNEVVLTIGSTVIRRYINDSVTPYGYVGHLFNAEVTGLLTVTLTWANPAVDLDLYLTRSTCRAYPPANCTMLAWSMGYTTIERVSWSVRAGEGYGVWVDSWSRTQSQAYQIELAYQPAALTIADSRALQDEAASVENGTKPADARKVP